MDRAHASLLLSPTQPTQCTTPSEWFEYGSPYRLLTTVLQQSRLLLYQCLDIITMRSFSYVATK